MFLQRLDGRYEMKIRRRKFLKIVAGTGIGAIVTGCTKDSQKMTEVR